MMVSIVKELGFEWGEVGRSGGGSGEMGVDEEEGDGPSRFGLSRAGGKADDVRLRRSGRR